MLLRRTASYLKKIDLSKMCSGLTFWKLPLQRRRDVIAASQERLTHLKSRREVLPRTFEKKIMGLNLWRKRFMD